MKSQHGGQGRGQQGDAHARYGSIHRLDRGVPGDETFANFVGHDDRAVDQQAQRNDQTGHGHLLNRDFEVEEGDHRHQRAQRQDDSDHQCGAPSQRDQQHGEHQRDADQQAFTHALQRSVV
jgi:hypothetical protein